MSHYSTVLPIGVALRRMQPSDLPTAQALVLRSVDKLLVKHYPPVELAALRRIAPIDPTIVNEGGMFIIDVDGVAAAVGGWSRHSIQLRAMVGIDLHQTAQMRSLFVDPRFARRGLGSFLLALAEWEAAVQGFRNGALLATAAGAPLDRRAGWRDQGWVTVDDDAELLLMQKRLPLLAEREQAA